MNKIKLHKSVSLMIIIYFVIIIPNLMSGKVYSQSYKVGIQAGHWQEDSGALSCDKKVKEVDITLAIAQKVADLLKSQNITVDVLPSPATAVHNYVADAFVALHTDYCAGNNSSFKVSRWNGIAGTGLDGSNDKSDQLTQAIWDEYAKSTGIKKDSEPGHFAPCMRTYYALNPVDGGPVCIGNGKNWTQIQGIDHSTPGAIIEMGWLSGDLAFMTSPDGQNKMAAGIANAIIKFLNIGTNQTPTPTNSSSTVLVFDTSGSMGDPDASGTAKIEAARKAGAQILNEIAAENNALHSTNQVGVVSYNTTSTVISQLSSDIPKVLASLNNLVPINRTAMPDGLKMGMDLFGSTKDKQILILLSDGLPNIGLNTDMNADEATIKQQVLDLSKQAGQSGKCVYTVGFGDPASGAGSIDEQFLRDVAAASSCGSYYNAKDAIELVNTYLELRHTSTGSILLNKSGQIAQGQSIDLGTIPVAQNQATMLFTLNWPGSKLEPTVIDPAGKTVDNNYPGASISTTSTLVSVIVSNPPPGDWKVRIYGADVPEGQTNYKALLSVRQGVVITPAPTPTPSPVTPSGVPLALVTVIIAAGLVGVYAYSRSLKRGAHTFAGAARLRGISGLTAGRAYVLHDGDTLGRGSRSTILIKDPAVSRDHAVIRYADDAWFIQDTGSTGGVFVNGQRVSAIRLKPGDQVCLGDQVFVFEVG